MKNAIVKNEKKKCGLFRKLTTGVGVMSAMAAMTASNALAFSDQVTVTDGSGVTADGLMGKIIGILLTITRFVGIALVIYGVYEIVMSFMQNQPEAKTKGIVMALAGVVMIGLKTILGANGLGIIS